MVTSLMVTVFQSRRAGNSVIKCFELTAKHAPVTLKGMHVLTALNADRNRRAMRLKEAGRDYEPDLTRVLEYANLALKLIPSMKQDLIAACHNAIGTVHVIRGDYAPGETALRAGFAKAHKA